jgi:hypothetical protein
MVPAGICKTLVHASLDAHFGLFSSDVVCHTIPIKFLQSFVTPSLETNTSLKAAANDLHLQQRPLGSSRVPPDVS